MVFMTIMDPCYIDTQTDRQTNIHYLLCSAYEIHSIASVMSKSA